MSALDAKTDVGFRRSSTMPDASNPPNLLVAPAASSTSIQSGAQGWPANAVSKAALLLIADSVVRFGHEKGLRIFEMAPGVVETAMTKSMPVHDVRGAGDWTSPEQVTDFAVALSSGTLDAYTGRYVRAGADSEESLLADNTAELVGSTRRLVLG